MTSGNKLKDRILYHINVVEFYKDLFPEWEEGENISCPFAGQRHEKKTDKHPSMSINEKTGGVFCHSCGYKASSPIGLLEDLEDISFNEACKKIYSEYVEPLVLDNEFKKDPIEESKKDSDPDKICVLNSGIIRFHD